MSNGLFTLGTQQSSDPLFYEISDTLEDEEEKLLNEKSDWKPSNDAIAKKNETFAKEKVKYQIQNISPFLRNNTRQMVSA